MSEQVEQTEQEARTLGWVPKEEFRGDESRWIEAEAFVERGKHIMPILQKNNEKLQAQLREESQARIRLEGIVAASQESMKALEEHYTAANKRQVADARQALLTELKAAKVAGDTDAEVQILDELSQIKAAGEEKPVEKKAEAVVAKVVEDLPEVKAFKSNNSWYGTDLKKTVAFNRVLEDLRLDGESSTGQAFLDKGLKKYEEGSRSTSTKVESGGGRGGSGGASKTGSRFADLPSDAKEACHADTKRLVGEGKRYKTLADWEKGYANIYFGDAT